MLAVHRHADCCLVTSVDMFRLRYNIVLSLTGFLWRINVEDYVTALEKRQCHCDRMQKRQLCMHVCHYMNYFSLCCAMGLYTLNGRKNLSSLAFFFFFRRKSPLLVPEVWNREFKCSAKKDTERNISQGCRRESGSSRRLVMFWPQCKSISAILLMNWSMIYTVSGARFLPPPLAKCWQRLSVFSRPFVLLWVSWFVLFILNPWSSLVVSW